MTFRQLAAYALIAGVTLGEARRLTPGMVCDLYIYRMRYDDMEHGIKRQRASRCED